MGKIKDKAKDMQHKAYELKGRAKEKKDDIKEEMKKRRLIVIDAFQIKGGRARPPLI